MRTNPRKRLTSDLRLHTPSRETHRQTHSRPTHFIMDHQTKHILSIRHKTRRNRRRHRFPHTTRAYRTGTFPTLTFTSRRPIQEFVSAWFAFTVRVQHPTQPHRSTTNFASNTRFRRFRSTRGHKMHHRPNRHFALTVRRDQTNRIFRTRQQTRHRLRNKFRFQPKKHARRFRRNTATPTNRANTIRKLVRAIRNRKHAGFRVQNATQHS